MGFNGNNYSWIQLKPNRISNRNILLFIRKDFDSLWSNTWVWLSLFLGKRGRHLNLPLTENIFWCSEFFKMWNIFRGNQSAVFFFWLHITISLSSLSALLVYCKHQMGKSHQHTNSLLNRSFLLFFFLLPSGTFEHLG